MKAQRVPPTRLPRPTRLWHGIPPPTELAPSISRRRAAASPNLISSSCRSFAARLRVTRATRGRYVCQRSRNRQYVNMIRGLAATALSGTGRDPPQRFPAPDIYRWNVPGVRPSAACRPDVDPLVTFPTGALQQAVACWPPYERRSAPWDWHRRMPSVSHGGCTPTPTVGPSGKESSCSPDRLAVRLARPASFPLARR